MELGDGGTPQQYSEAPGLHPVGYRGPEEVWDQNQGPNHARHCLLTQATSLTFLKMPPKCNLAPAPNLKYFLKYYLQVFKVTFHIESCYLFTEISIQKTKEKSRFLRGQLQLIASIQTVRVLAVFNIRAKEEFKLCDS